MRTVEKGTLKKRQEEEVTFFSSIQSCGVLSLPQKWRTAVSLRQRRWLSSLSPCAEKTKGMWGIKYLFLDAGLLHMWTQKALARTQHGGDTGNTKVL